MLVFLSKSVGAHFGATPACLWVSISGKRQKLPAKRSRPSEAPTPAFDDSRFANMSAVERFGTICKNRSFIKEKGFHHPDDFFRKTIEAKGWRALC